MCSSKCPEILGHLDVRLNILVFQDVNMYFLGCYFATFTKFVNTLRWDGGQSLYIYWTLISDVDNLSV